MRCAGADGLFALCTCSRWRATPGRHDGSRQGVLQGRYGRDQIRSRARAISTARSAYQPLSTSPRLRLRLYLPHPHTLPRQALVQSIFRCGFLSFLAFYLSVLSSALAWPNLLPVWCAVCALGYHLLFLLLGSVVTEPLPPPLPFSSPIPISPSIAVEPSCGADSSVLERRFCTSSISNHNHRGESRPSFHPFVLAYYERLVSASGRCYLPSLLIWTLLHTILSIAQPHTTRDSKRQVTTSAARLDPQLSSLLSSVVLSVETQETERTMSVSVMYEPANTNPQMSGIHPVAIPRPQVGIERLPARRMSNEPRESMNCKSCRKRKVSSPSPCPLASGPSSVPCVF